MKTNHSFWARTLISVLFALPIAGIHPAAAAVLWVTNDGADNSSCGSQTAPCRSISQGIENASDGDTIEVGAGHYGNVSGNVNFTGPGDEHPQATAGCIVCITKGLNIVSVHGAAVTVIDGIPSTPFGTTVLILSDGVRFGQAGGGFTLTGGNTNGVAIDQNARGYGGPFGIILKRNVTVAGNVDVGDGNGFVFNGWDFEDIHCPAPSCLSTAQITFSDNESINNGAGFNVTVNTYTPPITLQSNLARGAGTGFLVTAGGQDEVGLELGAGNVSVLGNVALRNGTGFNLTLIGRTEDNTAAGNSQIGFWVVPSGTFLGNSALGNGGPGVLVNFSANFFLENPLTNNYSSFSQNNFYGNDRNRPALNVGVGPVPAPNPGPSADCGVLNLGDLAAAEQPGSGLPTMTLQVGGNFWGSAHGPAPTGAGDAVGGACDQNGGVTIAKPFATTALPITSLP
jgi:hypothetical protein